MISVDSCADGAGPFFTLCTHLVLHFLHPLSIWLGCLLILCLLTKWALMLSGLFSSVCEFSPTTLSMWHWATKDPVSNPHTHTEGSLTSGAGFYTRVRLCFAGVFCILDVVDSVLGCYWIRSSVNRQLFIYQEPLQKPGAYYLKADGRNAYD